MAATLSDLDAALAKNDALLIALKSAVDANTAEIQALKTAGTPDVQAQVDKVTVFQTAVDGAVQALNANVPTPAPAPAPVPGP